MEEKINVLDELNKGACMGMDAIKYIIPKTDDKKFKKELDKEYKNYQVISDKINRLYSNYSGDYPHETSKMEDAMTWFGIEMRTIMDTSTSKLAELMLQGTNMGIIEGRKLLNHKDIDKEINDLISEYVTMQEEAVENLKQFL